jgi:3',5'-cyclic-AMP phosphodiesterase
MTADVSTVADDLVVIHDGVETHRFDGLEPDTPYTFLGLEARTLPRPGGDLLCRFAAVNDVHFGEVECGRIDDHPMGPILRLPPDHDPYPEVMNRGAVAEVLAIDPAAVLVKGDLTNDGRPEEFARFREVYGVFGDRLHVVRGNHDSYRGQAEFVGDEVLDLPGVRVVLLDTTIPCHTTGRFTNEQLELVETAAGESAGPVLVFGHHQIWVEGNRDPAYFGVNPDDSDAFIAVASRQRRILGYFAGHTHRNRVRTRADAPGALFVEVGCVKDFPGSWAEYRVFEGGILQVHHRISTPEALAWSEQCRNLYRDFGVDYVEYAQSTIEHRCFPIWPR